MQWDAETPGVIDLPSGRRVRGRRVHGRTVLAAEWTLVLTTLPPGSQSPGQWICWPDFAIPLRAAAARRAVAEAWERSTRQRVEVACGGGVGRTGTVLAAMVMLDGLGRDEAITWVRERYHPHAVETPWQRRWLGR